MNSVRFIAANPKSALEHIHRQLGPDAVVLSVRRLPTQGFARLWQRNLRVEILAGVPDKTSAPDVRKRSLAGTGAARRSAPGNSPHLWQSVAWLEAEGLLPAAVARLQAHLDALHPSPPASFEDEWEAVRAALAGFWLPPRPVPAGPAARTHVFVGPPGAGKTTVLCKWLTLAVLTEERSACVWRLDGAQANTAELLTVHCEMLGVPVERFWSEPALPADLHFVDLPGVEAIDARALNELRSQLSVLPCPEIHLVLNAAYHTEALLAHYHAFAALEPTDLILTHLDEETHRVRLWNLIFGTNCTIRFLSAGQKIPGEFRPAGPDLLFPPEVSQ
jgi:flagellar biosynthesis protein FlhF